MEDDVVIRIRGLRKAYKIIDPSVKKIGLLSNKYTDYPIFEGIDLDVKRGDIVGILGRNGCGKSTFLKIVSQIVEPDEGTVEVEGKVASILELSMGFHGDLSGRDNIVLRSELYGIPRDEVRKHIDEIVEYSDLGVFIDNPVRTYSSGMRSRLAFAIMVNVDADIFLVDEALSTGDMAFASKASEHLKNLVRSGKTVLFTSHSLGTIQRTCTRAIWISERTIRMDGEASEVCDAYARSINDSVEETMSLAKGGSSSAQYRLSTFYRDGNGVERNHEEQRKWLEEAAMREHPMAMDELADILMSEGTAESVSRAIDLYQRAAENGNFDARRKYATMYGDTHEDIETLKEMMAKLAESGYPFDLFNYGSLLYKSALIPSEYEEAFKVLTAASEAGWLEADTLLAQMYREGTGVDRSIEKSIQILEDSANRGNSRAMSSLGDLFLDGKFVQRDPVRAYEWYLKSACCGYAKSQYQVAVMLSSGLGVEKDEEAAKEWFARYSSSMVNDSRKIVLDTYKKRGLRDPRIPNLLKASSLCYNTNSMVTLAGKYSEGRDVKKNPGAAFSLMTKAAVAGGQPRARLGEMYMDGVGVDPDPVAAKKLFEDAAAFGDANAMYRLAMMYKDGIACEPDQDNYRMYMRMAAERGSRDAKEVVMKWDDRVRRRRAKAEGSDRPEGSERPYKNESKEGAEQPKNDNGEKETPVPKGEGPVSPGSNGSKEGYRGPAKDGEKPRSERPKNDGGKSGTGNPKKNGQKGNSDRSNKGGAKGNTQRPKNDGGKSGTGNPKKNGQKGNSDRSNKGGARGKSDNPKKGASEPNANKEKAKPEHPNGDA